MTERNWARLTNNEISIATILTLASQDLGMSMEDTLYALKNIVRSMEGFLQEVEERGEEAIQKETEEIVKRHLEASGGTKDNPFSVQ